MLSFVNNAAAPGSAIRTSLDTAAAAGCPKGTSSMAGK